MEKVKIRIEAITPKEAIQRDARLLEFLTDDKRIKENSWAGNYRMSLNQVNQSIYEIQRTFFA
jgi:hypothetical protein